MENNLQPQDLRYKNLVEYNGMYLPVSSIKSPKPLKDKRYADKWLIELFDGASCIDCTIDEIKAIPLTEEWLLKAGLKSKTKYDVKAFHINEDLFIWKNIDLYYICNWGWNSSILPLISIKTVDELQNTCYFLGQELKIDLK